MTASKQPFRKGDRVRISDRLATPQDLKSGLYFSHYRGLTGAVQKLFGEEAAIEIDLESLPREILEGHIQTRNQMRDKWLAGLPDDQRRKLTPEQKQFDLRYVVLVGLQDVSKLHGKSRGTLKSKESPEGTAGIAP